MISNFSDQTKWEKFIYTKIDMTSTNEDFIECSFYCTYLDENCDTFLYENHNCYIGNSMGNGTDNYNGISTIFLTDSALTNYVVPLTTTYCCVKASRFKDQDTIGKFQLEVNSGTVIAPTMDALD